MAITLSPVATVTVNFADRDLNKASLSFSVSSGLTAAAVQTFVTTTAIPALQGIINGIIYAYSINYRADDVVVVNTDAAEASDVERKGVFQFVAANKGRSKFEVPSIDNIFVVDGTDVLDVTAPEVIAVRDLFITAVSGVQPVTPFASSYVNMSATPHKIHRGSSKG